ncbi:MAG: ATP-binding protein [Pseudomonadota bacterium]
MPDHIAIAPDRWRFPVYGLLLGTVVLGPHLFLASLDRRLEAAYSLVEHSRDVAQATYDLAYGLRSLESATIAQSIGIDTPLLRSRIEENLAEVPEALERLTSLTQDNAVQQRRMGELGGLVAQRMQLSRSLNASPDATRTRVEELVTRFPVRNALEGVRAEEERLLLQRQRTAEVLSQRKRAATVGAVITQLALLFGLLFVVWRSIGHRLRAERDGRKASARAMAVLQTVREPIVLLDARQHVVMHNAAFAEVYGLGEESAAGRPLAEVGDGAWNNHEVLQRLGDVGARGRELWDFEHPQRTAAGIQRHMLLNARRMQLPDSDDPVVLVTASDATAQKAAEQRITELNRQLEGKVEQVSDVNRELEAFSYSVSHDLRAPLRHIAGFADKLGKHLGEAADEKSRHYLEVIGGSAQRMSTLIDDLLVYSRLGRSAIRLQKVDMQTLVAETRSLLDANNESDDPGHRIQWRIAPLPIVIADENMMRQLWLNLLGNAVKYSGKREPAVIEVEHRRLDDGAHEFSVRDNGAGFDMAYAGKLFGVFQRMHKASEYSGTGIGLASVRRVLGRHGGTITAEAALDAGATFRFVLPETLDALTSKEATNA